MEEEQKEILSVDERYKNETLTIERNLLCKYSGWQVNVFIVLWTHREGMTKEEIFEYLRSGPGAGRALRHLEEQGIVAPDKNGVYTIQEKYLDLSLPAIKRKPAKQKTEGDQKVVKDVAQQYYNWLWDTTYMSYICKTHLIIVDKPRTGENLAKALKRYHDSFVQYLMRKGLTHHDRESLKTFFDNWMRKIRAKERQIPPAPITPPAVSDANDLPF
jgi:hypothetical protein